jgi:glyoxylase-like metal-dependent hydrolase (beta-lactamase superfamily II)
MMIMLDFKIILSGVPLSSDRGALGWCTVSLIEISGTKILFDTGSYGDRGLLLEELKNAGTDPDGIDIVFISHLHFDHFLNVELFPESKIIVSERELNYVLEGEFKKTNDPYVPFSMVTVLKDHLTPCREGEEIVAGMKVVLLPGHTPGTSGLFYEKDHVLFASDGVKNGWEFVNNEPPPSFYSEKAALANYEFVREQVDIVIPGHDRPFNIKRDNRIEYIRDFGCTVQFYPDPYGSMKKVNLSGKGISTVG